MRFAVFWNRPDTVCRLSTHELVENEVMENATDMLQVEWSVDRFGHLLLEPLDEEFRRALSDFLRSEGAAHQDGTVFVQSDHQRDALERDLLTEQEYRDLDRFYQIEKSMNRRTYLDLVGYDATERFELEDSE